MAIDLPAEKVAFIAYNIGVFESVQKFGSLITSGRITGATDPARVAELLAETYAFYDAEMLSQLMNSIIRASTLKGQPVVIENVNAGDVQYVMQQLKAAGVSLKK